MLVFEIKDMNYMTLSSLTSLKSHHFFLSDLLREALRSSFIALFPLDLFYFFSIVFIAIGFSVGWLVFLSSFLNYKLPAGSLDFALFPAISLSPEQCWAQRC